MSEIQGHPSARALRPDLDDGFNATMSRVRELAHIEDEDEAPAPHALSAALDFLTQTRRFLKGDIPKGAATVGDDGSIDVYWKMPGRMVQVMIPADEQRTVSVYHRNGTDYSIDKSAAPETLAHRLEWFARA